MRRTPRGSCDEGLRCASRALKRTPAPRRKPIRMTVMPNPPAAGPLAGVRIVDMTTVIMGPYATSILADYGADVIKVEPPAGDVMRYGGAMRHHGMGALFLQINRNKRSVVLDVKKEEGRQTLLRLCANADVF